ncbi:sensor histidine kinase [Paenibacillus lutimineralis]|uniref:histidine kinase n=1 Tax=Paenibacillus lutimineralis TaxID=2707005 RepID=A0A3S9V0V0_9BACL|nr:HAMP domain-containing sensor histidine kinase [Paenibacillus lutimineralis]AZS16229.1 HAMP domain-containing protein [Paenibacillus lutimineralis]
MSRVRRKGITYKIFIITNALLIASTFLIFVIFYYFLPTFYHQYKVNTLNKSLDQLVSETEQMSFLEAKKDLDNFTLQQNVSLVVVNESERIVYLPSIINVVPYSSIVNGDEALKSTINIDKIKQTKEVYSSERQISLQEGTYTLLMIATLQPINEASQVMLQFAPYVLVLILLISIMGAAIYSRLISRPLLKVNRVAERMANLDFTRTSTIDSNDEIGELSRSLNRLSCNLQESMTDLRQANQQLSIEIDKVRELEGKRSAFIATVSHELKTPITAVSGQIEGMIHNIGAYKDRDKYLQRSYVIMKDMEKLVHELLNIFKLESAGFEPQLELVNVSNLVQNSMRRLEYASNAKSMVVETNIVDSLWVRADRNLIEKAITNVIQNAIQYSTSGERVVIRLESVRDHVVFQVLNTGASIPSNQLSEIFEPFHRIEKSRNRNTGGSGLGLYIVKQILDLHHIEYSITNTKKGVLFQMKFQREDS